LETIYLTYIRPLLEYADVIWDNNITYLVDKIEKVQMEAARIVTGGTRLVSLNNLYLETGWDKLKNRQWSYVSQIYGLQRFSVKNKFKSP
jgi:hypothetical protein